MNRVSVESDSVASRPARIPVLLYHSWNDADHGALESDLRTLDAEGYRVVPLFWAVEWMLGRRMGSSLPDRPVAITFDDGGAGDWFDRGSLKSFRRILDEFRSSHPAQVGTHGSSFVIGSPTARRWIDPEGGLRDDWWAEANASGLIEVYNHGADHDHDRINAGERADMDSHPPFDPSLYDPDLGVYVAIGAGVGGGRGTADFTRIDEYVTCDMEVRRSAAFIGTRIAPAWPDLFAYPYGAFSPYLASVYFPDKRTEHGTVAAFRTGTGALAGNFMTRETDRWLVPRFTFGHEFPDGWRHTAGLVRILRS